MDTSSSASNGLATKPSQPASRAFCSSDVNAWAVTAFNGNSNRMWGIWDSSFLGNTYVGCHVAGNGWDGAVTSGNGIPTGCTMGGNRYYVKRDQEAGASTNAPSGTTADNVWWGYVAAGGVYSGVPAWVSGTVFRTGGAYRCDGFSSANVLVGCYSEGDQGSSQIEPRTLVLGGLHGAAVVGNCAVMDAGIGGARIIGNLEIGKLLTVNGDSGGVILDVGRQTGASGVASSYNLNSDTAINFLNFKSWVGGAPMTDGSINSFRGYGLLLNGKPDIYFKADAVDIAQLTSGGLFITGPGTKLGYGAGAGGAVTQATSKATGVTLNKASGQVTLHNAALAAGASVSFTLTNSVIAATDVVVANIGSGATADAYAVEVTAVVAGSCRIQLRNDSAAALSEALLLNFAVIKAVAA